MSQYNKLSAAETAHLDTLIEQVKLNPNFITFITPVVPVVVKVTPVVTPAVVGASATTGSLASSQVNLLQGKATVDDLIAIRKSLVE